MDACTYEKATKDPKRVEAGLKGRKNFMNKMKVEILNDAKIVEILPVQAMKLPALPTIPPPQDQMGLMSMALACLRSLPLVLVYFLHITLFNLKISQTPKRHHIL